MKETSKIGAYGGLSHDTFILGRWTLIQRENVVTIALQLWEGLTIQTGLQTSWFGYKIGCPPVFETEAQANYWFEETKKLLRENENHLTI